MIKKYSFITAAGALAVGAVLALSGCSSHASSSSAAATKGSSQSQGQGQSAGQGQGGAGNGTSGEIAAISGTTLQVQSSSDQTAVDYTSSTKITQTVSVALSAVKVGECVTASSIPASGSSTSSPSASSSSSSAVTTVTVSQPTNGSCTSGFGAGRGGASGTRATTRPSVSPSNRPSNRPSGSRGNFGGGDFTMPTSGKVTAVSGSSITVDALDFQTQKTAPKTVTVSSATKYTETETATSSALAVGKCVVALGSADDSGTVAATSITVSSPVNGSCTTGFGGRGGFGGGRNGGSTGGQSGTTNG